MKKLKWEIRQEKKDLLSRGIDLSGSRCWDYVRFNDSLLGCLGEEINVKNIKDNLDRGHKLTKKYNKYEENLE